MQTLCALGQLLSLQFSLRQAWERCCWLLPKRVRKEPAVGPLLGRWEGGQERSRLVPCASAVCRVRLGCKAWTCRNAELLLGVCAALQTAVPCTIAAPPGPAPLLCVPQGS